MTEEFLHHIWKFRLFDLAELKTTENESVEIIKPGDHNFDAGPDFFNARIRIGNTLWAGNVEVHINASDWRKHNHQDDKAYENIVLHVVNHADLELYRPTGEKVPTLELKSRIGKKLYQRYLDFKSAGGFIACENQISGVPALVVNGTMDRALLERLERKSNAIKDSLLLNHHNWEETFYQYLARNFGFKINAEAFELLSKSLPLTVVAKHRTSLLQMEALLFGQAGMLEAHVEDKYALALQNEYAFLKHKFGLVSIDTHLWKFLRLRPVNFPTIRIAQFAGLLYHSSHLFSKVIEAERYKDLITLFNTPVSDYWKTHYTFGVESTKRQKHLGVESINTIIINTVVPFLFVYGKQKNDERYVDRALRFLEQTAGENNTIIRAWKELGVNASNGYATQALLQQKTEHCVRKNCLNCNIGNYLLKNS